MDTIELARIEERRQAVGTAELCSHAEPIAGGIMCYEAPDFWANQACGLGLDGPVSAHDLDRLVSFYRERGARARIEVAAHAHASLAGGLAERGFTLKEFENVYATDIAPEEDLRARWPHVIDPSFRVDVIAREDRTHWLAFTEVATSGFEPRLQPDGSVLPLDEHTIVFLERIILHERTTCIGVWHGGDLIGAAAMEIVPELCCLFGGCVLPAFRRRGVQAQMLIERMRLAQMAGCPVAVTHTKPGIATERNCRRLGYELAYTKAVLEGPPVT